MLNFIVLKSKTDDKKLYINPNHICAFYTTGEGHETIVQFANPDSYFQVKETPEEIKEMIDNISNAESEV